MSHEKVRLDFFNLKSSNGQAQAGRPAPVELIREKVRNIFE